MRALIDLGGERGTIRVMDAATTVDCGKEIRLRRSFRSLVECIVPCCGLSRPSTSDLVSSAVPESAHSSSFSVATTVTGTFFGFRKGRVSFCLQQDARSPSPLLLLEFALSTSRLAREMQHGMLRIMLECDKQQSDRFTSSSCSLFDVPIWSMFCNGRRVGFAMRRSANPSDVTVLRLMRSVSVGAGVLPVVTRLDKAGADHIMYLRASFERVIGSADSESFHMINPVGSSEQELSIFLLRS